MLKLALLVKNAALALAKVAGVKILAGFPGGLPGFIASVAAVILVFVGIISPTLITTVVGGSGSAIAATSCELQGATEDQSAVNAASGDSTSVAMDAYKKAGAATGLDWAMLAGFGRVESLHGTHDGSKMDTQGNVTPKIVGVPLNGKGPVAAVRYSGPGAYPDGWDRAQGPMQFIMSTWYGKSGSGGVGSDGNGDGKADPHNYYDATLTAAKYLKSNGAPGNWKKAIWAYNRSTKYYQDVMHFANLYKKNGTISDTPTASGAAILPGNMVALPTMPKPAAPIGPTDPGSTSPVLGPMKKPKTDFKTYRMRTETVQAAWAVGNAFPELKTIGGWRAFSASGADDHPTGRGLDIMIPNWNTPQGKALGDRVHQYLMANAKDLKVEYLIWRQTYYPITRKGKARKMASRGGYTANHMDHVHARIAGTTMYDGGELLGAAAAGSEGGYSADCAKQFCSATDANAVNASAPDSSAPTGSGGGSTSAGFSIPMWYGGSIKVDSAQVKNVQIALGVADKMKITPRGKLIMLETMGVESGYYNVASRGNPASINQPHDKVVAGDLDSVGLFQQRNTWGSIAERMNPAKTTELFLKELLRKVPNYDTDPRSSGLIAQKVQVSAHPARYDKMEAGSKILLSKIQGIDVGNMAGLESNMNCTNATEGSNGDASAAAKTVIDGALSVLGTPYSWGGGGPRGATRGVAQGANTVGFDHSGLVQFAYAKIGAATGGHTAADIAWARGIGAYYSGTEGIQPGDVAYNSSHAAIYMGNGKMVHAPRTGDVVKVSKWTPDSFTGYISLSQALAAKKA